MSTKNILHLKTQRDQPYGSVRRCCEECGKMIWGDSLSPNHEWTDDPEFYKNAGDGEYITCIQDQRSST